MGLKSERLRKLEAELKDLRQWLELGLVPKSDIKKHKEEIQLITNKIAEEKERLHFLKESGETEEFIAPKRVSKQPYTEPQALPDMDVGMEQSESGMEIEFEAFEGIEEEAEGAEEETTIEDHEEENPFSDKNRWKRGILEDPDADNW